MSIPKEQVIMEMKFDNGDFERNVKTSMATLGQLKDALNMDGVTKGLGDIEKATKGIDFSGIGAGIDALNEKFSGIGVAGKKVIMNMVDDAYSFVKNKVLAIPKFITNNIIQGGISRAMKIENAKFQLEGLKVAWADIEKDINYGVSDTAYGLDAAATAASQLVASGIQFGEEFGETGNSPMAKALRGISGVAAMTNREYDEISRIFTTVAGNGRMMGDQLNELGTRGINAAATLSDFFNAYISGEGDVSKVSKETLGSMAHALAEMGQQTKVTEADIRDMVSKGLISFDIFSEAMDNAFGEHAKDANRTFNGALSNIKAALSRIGANYITPLIQTDSDVVKLLNSIRTKFNEFNKSVASKIAPAFTSFVLRIADDFRRFIEAIRFDGISVDTEDLKKKFMAFRNVLIGVWNIIKGLLSPIKPLIQAFREVFAAVAPTGEALMIATQAFRSLTERFRLSYTQSENLKNAFKGLFSVIDMVARVVGVILNIGVRIISVLLKPVIKVLGIVGNIILSVLSFIGKSLVVADEWVRKNITVNKVIEFAKNILGAFVYVGLKAVNAFKKLGTIIGSKVAPVLSTVGQAFKMVGQWISEVFVVPDSFKNFIDSIKKSFEPIVKVIKGSIDNIVKFFKLLTDKSFRAENGILSIKDVLLLGWTGIIETFKNLGSAVKDTFTNLFGNISLPKGLIDFKNNLVSVVETIFENLRNIGSSFGGLFGAIFGGGDVRSSAKELASAFGGLGTPLKSFVGVMGSGVKSAFSTLSEFLQSNFNLPDFSKYNSFKDMALGVFDSISESISNTITSFRLFAQEKIGLPEFSGLARFQEFLMSGLETTREVLREIISHVSGFFDKLVGRMSFSKFEKVRDKISEIFTSIKNTIKGLFSKDVTRSGFIPLDDFGNPEQLSKLEQFKENFLKIVESISSFLKEAFKGVKITDIIDAVIEFGLAKSVIDAYNNINKILKRISDFVKKLTSGKTSFTKVMESIAGAIDNFGGIGQGIQNTLDTAQKSLKDFSKSLQATAIQKIAVAVLILAAALGILALIPDEKIKKSLGALTVIIGDLIGVMVATSLTGKSGSASIKKGEGAQISTFKTMATNMLALAGAIVIIAQAVKTISDIEDPEKLKQGLIGVSVIAGLLSGVMIAFNKLNVSGKGGFSNAVAMVGFGVSIRMLVSSLKVLGEMDPDAMERGALGLVTIMAMITLALGANATNENVLRTASSMVIMSAAMLIMAGALAILGSIPWITLLTGLGAMALIILEMAMAYKLINNSDVIKIAASMAIFGAAMYVMAGAIAVMGSISLWTMIKGLGAIIVVILEVAAAFKMINNTEVLKIASSMIVFGAAMLVMAGAVAVMGSIPLGTMIKGLAAIMVVVLEISAAFKMINNSDVLKIAASMAVFGASMLVVAGAVAVMGSIPVETMVKGLSAIMVIILEFAAAGHLLSGVVGTLVGFAGALALISVAVALTGAGLLAFAVALELIAASGMVAAYVLADMVKLLFEKFLRLVVDCADVIMEAVIELIQIAVNAIIESVDIIVDGVFTLIEHIVDALVERGPEIVDMLLVFVIEILQVLATRFPELLDPILDIVGTFFTMLFDRIAQTDPTYFIQALEMFGIVTALIVALNIIGPMIPGAMASLLGVSAFIAELSLLLAALGALNSIPGLQDFVDKGGELLTSVGRIIGEFVGNLIGGVIGGTIEGITSSLPNVGANLSLFWNNASDFINGAKSLPAGSFDSVKSLVEALLLLTANDFLNGIKNFFGIEGTSLADFAEQLKEFAEPYVEFANTISGSNIDSAAVESSANALKIMADAAKAIPNSGGKLADLIGDNTLEQFAKELDAFGPSIVSYSSTVDGKVSEEAVTASANALKIMTEAAGTVQNQGGLLAELLGDNKLSDFAKELDAFGPSIVSYSSTVDGKVSETAVTASANALTMMADAAGTVQNQGGLLSELIGDNSLSTFGKELEEFGPAIVAYSAMVDGRVSESAINSSATAVSALITMAQGIQNSGGLVSLFTGDNDLATFGESLISFGASLYAYSESISGLNTTQMAGAANQMQKLVDLANGITYVDMTKVSAFADNMKNYGVSGLEGFTEALSGVDADASVRDSVAKLVGFVTTEMPTHLTELEDTGEDAATSIVNGLSDGITAKEQDVLTSIRNVCIALIDTVKKNLLKTTFEAYGSNNVVSGIAGGINSKKKVAEDSAKGVCDAIKQAFDDNISRADFEKYGKNVVGGVGDGLNDVVNRTRLVNGSKALKTIITNQFASNGVDYLYNDMFKIGANATQGLINGLNSKLIQLQNTAKSLAAEIKNRTTTALGVSSPSKVMYEIGAYSTLGLINGLLSLSKDLSYAVDDTTDLMVDPLRDAIAQVAELVDYGIDADPTIRPVLDLTDIQNGVQTINGLFSEGIDMSASYKKALRAGSANNDMYPDGRTSDAKVLNNYNYTQNNYSPKALSRSEIYRQTKNQFAAMKGAVSRG